MDEEKKMGARLKFGEETVITPMRLTESVVKKVAIIAQIESKNKSAIIRQAIDEYLANKYPSVQ